MEPLISLMQVRKVYKTKAGTLEVLKGIDFEVGAGEFVSIVGPSGSGKSTLINMITGIDRPTEGDVVVASERLTQMSENKVAKWRGRNVGVVFQFFQLLPMHYAGTYTGKRYQSAMKLLERVELPEVADKCPSQISGGQQQRAAIARALANDPKLIVGDEPTGNLDVVSAGLVFALFEELVAQGTTIIMVTHDRDLAGQVPHVIEVRDGCIVNDVDPRLVTHN
jgi:putative ABC transport system ATP-binding protein